MIVPPRRRGVARLATALTARPGEGRTLGVVVAVAGPVAQVNVAGYVRRHVRVPHELRDVWPGATVQVTGRGGTWALTSILSRQ